VYNARSETASVFSKYTFTNWKLGASVIFVFVMQLLITMIAPLRNLFDTSSLSLSQWGLCLLPPALLLVAVECWKIGSRRRLAAAHQGDLSND
jgi:Ca2+-transporting ATPase